ncbi:GNAT family N-acetyltransferase [Sporosarcina limicola]|uniref:Ribosomal protein S18 acetylase RimI-like enzyme n=1 Tax=Sporosarcina limicola TaxID=34101 RepID=A0A927MLY6_9BACL|nr:GNAT family N-acetyltransferase [Sporosarcina limicola]MBE1555547.1 ribosomal protein S18 acetylase RimI-like enzyme [Sporosarcina limicola]
MEFHNYKEIPKQEILEGIHELHRHVFEGSELSVDKLKSEQGMLFCVAIDADRVVGFKIGYEVDDGNFYSWLGGVHSNYRGQGIASTLLRMQHKLVKELGYSRIRTISRNHRREMLILNIKNGFDIIETFTSKKGTHKIVLEKDL